MAIYNFSYAVAKGVHFSKDWIQQQYKEHIVEIKEIEKEKTLLEKELQVT